MEAKKQLSQNFLTDLEVINEFIEAANILHGETVLEIGPGKGALTAPILQRGAKLIAVEKDSRLIPLLQKQFSHAKIIEGDILEFPLEEIEGPVKVISNLPFQITAPILSRLVQAPNVGMLYVIVQEEMARRICAHPGSKEMSLLTLFLQNFSYSEYLFKIPATAFCPAPKIECAAIVLKRKCPLVPVEYCEPFFEFLHTPFRQKRKMLRTTLKAWKGIKEAALSCGVSLECRPEDVSLEQWAALYSRLNHTQNI